MSLISRKGLLRRIKRGRQARALLVSSNLSEGIAFQIRATRDKEEMTQADLAAASGMSQNNVSRLESPDYGKHTITSLKRIAEALDVALVVRFVPFSQYIDWLSGTPRLDNGLNSESLAVVSFDKDPGLVEKPELDLIANGARKSNLFDFSTRKRSSSAGEWDALGGKQPEMQVQKEGKSPYAVGCN
jgi:transcriptional regulator with XRE-family HTH domain